MSIFNFIKNSLSILDVVNEYATLKKAGHYWKGICPFHQERTPSFTVSPDKGIFYCFGCHEGGDLISFISKVERCSVLEATQFLAERYNIDVPEEVKISNSTPERKDEKKKYYALCQLVGQWCHQNLIQSPALKRYVDGRSINKKSTEDFTIGYFPGGQKSLKRLIDFVKPHNFLVQDLMNGNILAEGKSVLYSPFEERVIFPIRDHLGHYVGFGGRIYKKNDERPKYYNSKENNYFAKGSLLFNMDKAKPHIQKKDSVFLVEGYTDCLAMVQHEFENTVATLGTACTLEHLTLLARYAQSVYVVYDGDKAGKKAMLRLTELCWQVDIELKIISLPEGEDPASSLEKKFDFATAITSAQDIFIFSIESSAQQSEGNNMAQKVSAIRQIITMIARLQDPLKQEVLLQRASKSFGISAESLEKELKNQIFSKQKRSQNNKKEGFLEENKTPQTNKTAILKEIPILEKRLFSVIINNVHLLRSEDREYLLQYLNPRLKKLLEKINLVRVDTNPIDFIQFFDVLDEQDKNLVSHLVLECQEYEGSENFQYLLSLFQKKYWKSFVEDTKAQLQQAQKENNADTTKKIIYRFQELKQKLLRRGLI